MGKFILLVLLAFSFSSSAQFTICGHVTIGGQKAEGVLVKFFDYPDSVLTNKHGGFCFTDVPSGKQLVYAEFENESSILLPLLVNENRSDIHLEIVSSTDIEGVTIIGSSAQERKKEHSIKTEVIDLEAHQLSSVSVEQLMDRTAGVKVRNSNGLGADADIIIGGFNGKSVKFLVDGIPLNYLGTSMSVTKMPTNMASYIEVYKGVLPTEIGIDALGAAVNIVTKQADKTYGAVSYQIGSFNTHRLTANAFIRKSDKFSFGINAFVNYSDNNFKVNDLPYDNLETGKTERITSRLFHNGYQQISGEAYVNFENRQWADEFKITLNSYTLGREMQSDFASRNRAYGEVSINEYAYVVPSIRYKKTFFDRKLQVSQFLVYSHIVNEFIDTLSNAYYDWKGVKHVAVGGSETGTDLSKLNDPIVTTATNNATYRGLFTYRLSNTQKLVFNITDTYIYRVADDLNAYNSKTNINYNRLIGALGYQYSLFSNRMEGLTQAKYLTSHSNGLLNDVFEEAEETRQNGGFSLAQSLKWQTYNGWIFRASAENTYRLPDQTEVFGDNVFILPNLSLMPERSFNVNAGVAYGIKKYFKVEVNSYYRNIKDMIRLKDVTQFQANYQNIDNVSGFGLEVDAVVTPIENLELSGNITYNGFRFKGSNDNVNQNDHFVDARVSNMPFYFGNANIRYTFKKVFTKKDDLSIYWNYNYVHQYYLDFIEKQHEPDGFLGLYGKSKVHTNRVIPVQHIHSAGLIWSVRLSKDRKLGVSFEFNNIFDHDVYNHFKMQNAGRAFYTKFSFNF